MFCSFCQVHVPNLVPSPSPQIFRTNLTALPVETSHLLHVCDSFFHSFPKQISSHQLAVGATISSCQGFRVYLTFFPVEPSLSCAEILRRKLIAGTEANDFCCYFPRLLLSPVGRAGRKTITSQLRPQRC